MRRYTESHVRASVTQAVVSNAEPLFSVETVGSWAGMIELRQPTLVGEQSKAGDALGRKCGIDTIIRPTTTVMGGEQGHVQAKVLVHLISNMHGRAG